VPWRLLVRYSSLVYHSVTLDASLCILLLVARYADRLTVTWYECLRSYWLTTDLAVKALLVVLPSLELILLHTCSKDSLTGVTAQSKILVVALGAERTVIATRERSVDQRSTAVRAVEASLMPMLFLVRQVLKVRSYWLLAHITAVGKERLVALDTERLFLSENVPLSSQRVGAVKTVQTLTFQHEMLHL